MSNGNAESQGEMGLEGMGVIGFTILFAWFGKNMGGGGLTVFFGLIGFVLGYLIRTFLAVLFGIAFLLLIIYMGLRIIIGCALGW